jgi:hypothetical protein
MYVKLFYGWYTLSSGCREHHSTAAADQLQRGLLRVWLCKKLFASNVVRLCSYTALFARRGLHG